MGKYGRSHVISDDITDYNVGLIGEPGIGKTTLMKEVYEKLVGKDGYIILEIGKEDGDRAINGIVSEHAEDWEKYSDIIDDIVENKDTDYPDLKVIVLDTYDQLVDIATPEVIRMHNEQYSDKPPIASIKQAFGGYMGGEDKVVEIILNSLWRLKKVGVSFVVVGHVKSKDKDDPITGQSYNVLTTDITPRYFNAIKNKLDVLGVAHIDREIVRERTGKKNLVTKQEIVKGKVRSEERVITFRDDNYSVESKSRLKQIENEIPLDADAFIKAIQDAIAKEKGKSTPEEDAVVQLVADITNKAKELFASGFSKDEFYSVVESKCGTKMFNKVKDVAKLKSAYEAVINMKVEE